MDKKITELREAEELTGSEYLVVASQEDEETYKVKVSDFVDTTVAVDETLSHTSKNPVQNKAITQHIVNIENRLGEVEEFTERLLDLKVAQVDTVTLKPEESAKVEIYDLGKDEEDIKKLGFKFYIPRGAKGSGGTSGTPEGTINSGGRTVFAFKSSQTKPKRPEGGHWDPETNKITYPNGWSSTDNLVPPIWMSNATFENYQIVIDWSEPIKITGEDGVSGTDGTSIEFIYKLFKDEQTIVPTPPSDPNLSDYVPEGWEDHPMGVTKDMRCEYICSRTKDDETGRWKEWSTPALWSKYGVDGRDGDSVEYIYQLSLSEKEKPITPGTNPSPLSPVTNYQEREFIPASAAGELDWTDNPTGVSEKFTCEWVSVRKFSFTTQQWEAFSEPTLWAKYGVDGDPGEPGTGVRILGSYDSEDELNSAWQSGTLKGDNPPQTGDSYIVNGDIYVFDGDEFLNCGRLKGEPGESTYLHIKYSDDGISFTKGNGETIGKYIGIRVDYTKQPSDVFSDYTWSRFRGNDGFGYEYIFQLSTENVAPFVPTEITATGIAPEGWTADPTGVTSEIKYEWCCYRKSNEEGQWGPWTGRSGGLYAWLFAMWAESMPGETGKPGPILYPAGVWEKDEQQKNPTFTQKGSYANGEWVATATPYVLYNGTFYILDVESSSQEPGTGDDWLKMEKFNAIYTDILLANNAKVGQAIFNGDYMFSQWGVNTQTNEADYNYEDFGSPYTSNSKFDPNWCVNLRTGEMWMGQGKCYFSSDGSGKLADGNISWTSDGILTLPLMFNLQTRLENQGLTIVADYSLSGGNPSNVSLIEIKLLNITGDVIAEYNKTATIPISESIKFEDLNDDPVSIELHCDGKKLYTQNIDFKSVPIIEKISQTSCNGMASGGFDVNFPIKMVEDTMVFKTYYTETSDGAFGYDFVISGSNGLLFGTTQNGVFTEKLQITVSNGEDYEFFVKVSSPGYHQITIDSAYAQKNVQFVESLPSSPDNNALYIIV